MVIYHLCVILADMRISFLQVMKVVKDLLVTQTAGTHRSKLLPLHPATYSLTPFRFVVTT